MDDGLITAWYPSWLWSLPLIVLTVVIHVVGLSLINEKVVRPLSGIAQRRQFTAGFVIIMAVVAWLVTLLHAIEGFVWAFAYERLGALPNTTAAVLYSFSAMTA
jgi:MFS superfamily sulfate permease-like transporter